MALSINTNVASLNAQRNLGASQSNLNTSMQRLSSGLRINSAKDDAAGLAISDRMTSQIRGMNQAVRNSNDGISLAQTAEGALQESTNILQRVRELAVQSSNSSNTATDRASLNQEVQQLVSEYDRIASQTEFNGNKILTGSFSGNFQVGANVGQNISMDISDMRATAVGATSTFTTVRNEAAAGMETFAQRIHTGYSNAFSSTTLNGTAVADIGVDKNSLGKINAINDVSASSGVKAFSYGNGLISTSTVTGTDGDQGTMAAGTLTINGTEVGAIDLSGDATADAKALITAINAVSSETGVTAATDSTSGGDTAEDLVLANSTGAAITMNVGTAAAATLTGFKQGDSTVAAGANGAIVLSTELKGAISASSGSEFGYGGTDISGSYAADASVSSLSITTVSSAEATILAVDEALQQIDTERGSLGAIQNRFESTIANLQNVSENLSAARSRILDADIAQETSNMTKQNILQQAGVSILAQANQAPQLALSLLG